MRGAILSLIFASTLGGPGLGATAPAQSCQTAPVPFVWESESRTAPVSTTQLDIVAGPQTRGGALQVCRAELEQRNDQVVNLIYTLASCPEVWPTAADQRVPISFSGTPTLQGLSNDFKPHMELDGLRSVAATWCPLYWVDARAPARAEQSSSETSINPGNGNVFLAETDVSLAGPPGVIGYRRYYNSDDAFGIDGVAGWRHSYSRSVASVYGPTASIWRGRSALVSPRYQTPAAACTEGFAAVQPAVSGWTGATASYREGVCVIAKETITVATLPIQAYPAAAPPAAPTEYDVVRDDGQILRFAVIGTQLVQPPGISLRFAATREGFTVTDEDGTLEIYDTAGVLQSIATRAGVRQTLSYAGARLSSIADSLGHTLFLHRNARGAIDSVALSGPGTAIATSAGTSANYDYDAAGRLIGVTALDRTTRIYAYVDTGIPNQLLSIEDGAAGTLTRFAYDALGRGTSVRGGGSNDMSVAYNPNGTATVTLSSAATDARIAVRTLKFTRLGDIDKVSAVIGDAAPTSRAQ